MVDDWTPTRRTLADKPRPYDLSNPAEIRRLLFECWGYLHTCRKEHHGTDLDGRLYALDALRQYMDGRPTPLPTPDPR